MALGAVHGHAARYRGRPHTAPLAQERSAHFRRAVVLRSCRDGAKRRAEGDPTHAQPIRAIAMKRTIVLMLLIAGSLCAQMHKGIYAWWGRPEIRRDLQLSMDQQRQIQATVKQ